MEKEPSAKKGETKLNLNARVWVGMKEIAPRGVYERCLITPVPKKCSRVTITFRGLGLKELTLNDHDIKTPVMTEHRVPLSTPASLDTRFNGHNLKDESKWLTHKTNSTVKQDGPEELDKIYPNLYPPDSEFNVD